MKKIIAAAIFFSTVLAAPFAQTTYFSSGFGIDSLNGFTFGGNLTIARQVSNWNFQFAAGAGLNHAALGAFASYNGFGAGYYSTFYGNAIGPDGNSNSQIVGGISLFSKDFSIRFENDFFYMGDKYDRWRTTAIEIGVKNFVIGTFFYTNMPNKDMENYQYDEAYNGSIWKRNRKAYYDGEVYYSVFYIGYRYRDIIIRIGVNHPAVQDIIQNGWHIIVNKPFFYTPYGEYFSIYLYIGYYNPFSLFGR